MGVLKHVLNGVNNVEKATRARWFGCLKMNEWITWEIKLNRNWCWELTCELFSDENEYEWIRRIQGDREGFWGTMWWWDLGASIYVMYEK